MVEKKDVVKYLVIGLIFAGLVGILFVFRWRLTGFAVFQDSIQGDFGNGTYVNTTYNGSALVLVGGNLSGSYISQVFDAGGDSVWNNISWVRNLPTASIDPTIKTCSDTWGASCSGCTDNTMDSCASAYCDEWANVRGVYINATSVHIGDIINVTVTAECYDLSSMVSIAYYNGTWNNMYSTNCVYEDGAENHFTTLEVTGPLGTQWIRGMIQYNGASGLTCVADWDADNDDVNFSVIAADTTSLNLTVRSCDDVACSGEIWTDIIDTSPQDLSLDNNTYFQYKFDFESQDTSYTPELYNITIDYDLINTAPSVNLVSPQDGATYGYNESLDLNFSASDADDNLDSCWYNIDGGGNVSLAGCANTTFDVSGDGSYVLNIYVNDTAGEEVNDSSSFDVQVGAPTIVLHFPIDEYLNYQENIYFDYTPTDVDLDSCELWGDFGGIFVLNQTETSPNNGVVNSFNLDLNDGTYLWNIQCNDSVGNSAINGNKTFYVDTIAPNLSVSEPTGAKTSRIVSSSWGVSDDNLDSCWYSVYRGENIEIGNTSVGCSTNSISFQVTVDANFVFNFYVNDSAGNSNSTSLSFSVDTSSSGGGSPSGGGGGGGGGSRTTIVVSNESKTANLQVSKIGDIIAKAGDKKTLSLNVKNTGSIFLNNCKLVVIGEISSWISSTKVEGISPGESTDFAFDLNVPEETDSGNYFGKLKINCNEKTNSQDVAVSIPGKFELIEIKDIKQEDNVLTIVYEFDNSNLIGDAASVDVWLEDSDGYEITRFSDVFNINRDGLIERNIEMELENVAGIYYVYLALSDDLSNFIRESVVLGEPEGTGFVVFDTTKGKIGVYAVFLLIMVVSVYFIWKRHGKSKHSKNKWFFGIKKK